MELVKRNILISGLPGVGKTTLIKRLVDELEPLHPVGFYTAEIRDQGVRKGFELVSLDGMRGVLSHIEGKSPFKVGKYTVDITGFEDFLDSIALLEHENRLVVIDEIGKMECFSDKFKIILKKILDSDKLVIATIALKGGGIIAEVKKRKDTKLVEISKSNRNSLVHEVLEFIHKRI